MKLKLSKQRSEITKQWKTQSFMKNLKNNRGKTNLQLETKGSANIV